MIFMIPVGKRTAINMLDNVSGQLVPRSKIAIAKEQHNLAICMSLYLDDLTFVVVVGVENSAKGSERFASHQTT